MNTSAHPSDTTSSPAARRRRGALTAALCLVLAGCTAPTTTSTDAPTGATGTATQDAAASSAGEEAADTASGGPSGDQASATASSGADSAAEGPLAARSNERVPMRAFTQDEQPPQFVLYSFDGGLQNEKWDYFQQTAQEAGAHFTVFESGIHLVGDANRTRYSAPGNKPGAASTEFGGTEADVAARITNLNEAYAQGHEIGTHYNGHLCATTPYGGDKWTAPEWSSELAEWKTIMTDPGAYNGYDDVPDLEVPVESVKGGRLPCLEGKWDALLPAWKDAGFQYDTSVGGKPRGLAWPYKKDGIWEFEMPVVYSPYLTERNGKPTHVMTMDYNLWVAGNGEKEGDTAQLHELQLDTYRYMFESAYHGSRAPIVFGNHFNTWAGDAFNPAVGQTMKEFCGREDTYCVTYQQMVAWLELQDPEVLAAWQKRPSAANGKDLDTLEW